MSCIFFHPHYSSFIMLYNIGLVDMHSTAASVWAVTKFSYSSFGVCISDVSWRVSKLFLTVTVYLLFIFRLVSGDQSYGVAFTVGFLFLRKLRRIFAETIVWSEDTPSKEEYTPHFRVLFIDSRYFCRNKSIVSSSFLEFIVLPCKTSREKNLQDNRHFFSANCFSKINYFRLCLFEHSCLHRWVSYAPIY